jgi:hypothetical protein
MRLTVAAHTARSALALRIKPIRLIDLINGMVSGHGFVVLNTASRVAGKEIIQWRILQELTYTRK